MKIIVSFMYLGNDRTEGMDRYEVGVAGAENSLALSELSQSPADASRLSVVPTNERNLN